MMDNYFYFEKGSYGIRKDQNLSDQYPVSLVAFGIKIQLGILKPIVFCRFL